MNAVETAEKLRSYIWATMEVMERHNNRPDIVETGKEKIESLLAAEEAVKKQILKQPTLKTFHDIMRQATVQRVQCPCCSENITIIEFAIEKEKVFKENENYKHCVNCGQALDWSGESEVKTDGMSYT
ncbi:MAG: hypothetical protein K0R92_535 [Lachnospiraceae bacterium]|jgi:lipopolysaccharide biosynthesis regulator YciM|nr:hypothetical protein [Lachnospiraceae bacterium]